jgi:hypothetical protein
VSTGGTLAVTCRLLLAVARRVLLQSADGVAARKTAGTAGSSVRLDEAREWMRLVPTQVFSDLHLSPVTSSNLHSFSS